MTKYIFLIFFIISKVYANDYQLTYKEDFASCDGIENIVRENNHEYVTDVKISQDSSDIYKRVLFAYHSAHGASVKDKTNLDYYALLLKIKTEQKLDDYGEIVNVDTVDWRNSLLSKIYLSGDINEYIKSNHRVSECEKDYFNKTNNSIRDVLTLSGLGFQKTYRMDSFIAIKNTKLAELVTTSTQSQLKSQLSYLYFAGPRTNRKQKSDILNIEDSPDFVKYLWDQINNHRKIFLRSDYIAQMLDFNSSEQNEIIELFNSPSYSYTPAQIQHGISKENLSKNKYIVMKLADKKLFYMCALNLNTVSRIPLFTKKLSCFKVITNKTEGDILSIEDVTFTPTKISYEYSDINQTFIEPFDNDLKARYLGNHMIVLIGTNLMFDLRLVYFLKLGYAHINSIIGSSHFITVQENLSELEDTLIRKQKELKDDKSKSFPI